MAPLTRIQRRRTHVVAGEVTTAPATHITELRHDASPVPMSSTSAPAVDWSFAAVAAAAEGASAEVTDTDAALTQQPIDSAWSGASAGLPSGSRSAPGAPLDPPTPSRAWPIQPRLVVNPAHDPFEDEADRTAELIMSMPPQANPAAAALSVAMPASVPVQRASVDSGAGLGAVAPDIEQQIANLGSGQALTEEDQAFFTQRFGSDFHDVRIHLRPDLAGALSAQAFTVGTDIVFDSGTYAPGTDQGRRLLAHELTHVLQQRGDLAAPASVQTFTVQRTPAADAGVCPVCGRVGTGTCPDCGQPFVPIQRLPAPGAGPLTLVQRAPTADAGVCPVCGRVGTGTCPDCGQPFVPIQRMPTPGAGPLTVVQRKANHNQEPDAPAVLDSTPLANLLPSMPTEPGTAPPDLATRLAPPAPSSAAPVNSPLAVSSTASQAEPHATPTVLPAARVPASLMVEASRQPAPSSADTPDTALATSNGTITPTSAPAVPDMADMALDGAWDTMLSYIAATHANAHTAAAARLSSRPPAPERATGIAASDPMALPAAPVPVAAFMADAGPVALNPLAALPGGLLPNTPDLGIPSQNGAAQANALLGTLAPSGLGAPLLASSSALLRGDLPGVAHPLADISPMGTAGTLVDGAATLAQATGVGAAATLAGLDPSGSAGTLVDGAATLAQATGAGAAATLADLDPSGSAGQVIEGAADFVRSLSSTDRPRDADAAAEQRLQQLVEHPLRVLQRAEGEGGGFLEALIPDWVQGALDALRGEARSQQGAVQGQGQSDSGQVDSAAQTQGAVIQTDGQTKGTEVQTQGQTRSDELRADGQTQTTQLQAGQEQQSAELQAGQEQQSAELQAGQEQQSAKLQASAQQQSSELQAAQEQQAQQLQTDAATKGAELDTAAQAQQQQLQADFATTEQAAQVHQQELTSQVETRSAALQTEAMALEGQAQNRWATLEQNANSTMANLNAQATSLCTSVQEQATAYLDNLDPLIENAQASWEQVQEGAKQAWDGLQQQAQPVLDALGQQWDSFSTWFGQEAWPAIQQKAGEFASWVADSARAAWSWMQDTWGWLQDRWNNAEQEIAALADAARGWIGDKVLAAHDWINGKAQAAHDWINGKAQAAHDWINGKADTAQAWIGDRAGAANAWIGDQADTARGWIGDRAGAANTWIGDQAASAQAWLSGRADAVASGFRELGNGLVSGMATTARAAVNAVASNGGPIMQWFAGIVNGLISGVEGAGAAAVNLVSGALQRGLGFVEGKASAAVSFLSNMASGAVTLVQDAATGVVTLVEQGATGAVNVVASTASSVVSGVQTVANGAVSGVANVANGAVDLVGTAANTAVAGLGAVGQGVVTVLEQQALTTVGVVKAAGQQISQGWDTLSSAAGQALGWVGEQASQLGGWLNDKVFGPVSQWAGEQWNALSGWVAEQFPALAACWNAFTAFAGAAWEKLQKVPILGDYLRIQSEIWMGMVAGDMIENPSFWNIVGQVAMGFVPYAGQAADIRDIGAMLWRLKDGKVSWTEALVTLAAVVPGLDVLKAGKGGLRAVENADELMAATRVFTEGMQQVPPQLTRTLADNPQILDVVARNPQLAEAIAKNPDLAEQLARNPQLLDDLADGTRTLDDVAANANVAADTTRATPTRATDEVTSSVDEAGSTTRTTPTTMVDDMAASTDGAAAATRTAPTSAVDEAAARADEVGTAARTNDKPATHAGEPEVEPGIVAKAPTENGHTLKVTTDGKLMECSTCSIIEHKYRQAFDVDSTLRPELRRIEAITNPVEKAREAMAFQSRLAAADLTARFKPDELADFINDIGTSNRRLSQAEIDACNDLADRFRREIDALVGDQAISDALSQELATFLSSLSRHNVRDNPVLKKVWEITRARIADNPKFSAMFDAAGNIVQGQSRDDMIALYNEARGRMAEDAIPELNHALQDLFSRQFPDQALPDIDLPAGVQLHHYLYKAQFPDLAMAEGNLMLALRGGRGDPQLHELMHFISSAANTSGVGKTRWEKLSPHIIPIIRDVLHL